MPGTLELTSLTTDLHDEVRHYARAFRDIAKQTPFDEVVRPAAPDAKYGCGDALRTKGLDAESALRPRMCP